MKKENFLLILLLIFFELNAFAQNEALFKKGNDAYNEGDFVTAADQYLAILEKGTHSAELYFNLGNAYYKLNQIAPSIYYYEKALVLKPNDSEIINNLAYAQNMTLDAIETLPTTGLKNLYKQFTEILNYDQWAKIAVLFMILFVLLYIAFYFFSYSTRKRIAFISSLIALVCSVLAVVFAYIEFDDFNKNNPAIVFVKESQVKTEPNDRSQQAFILHEGTKVNVIGSLDDWQEIKLSDGQTGWISSENIKLIKDF
ncbi:tetratricopeptide repeat protein [Aurantibacter crassamenti]|uniref:SH3 domain-containing protein n=1 Tax=Aurantibacter crassamenti TaxID=1837375 RepID=UPI001939E214|nr:tetratricopeptide repeat protein [Aurantibacter crassamenti]MBM1104960.1 tetratricopeptide repeat protein [Aurantibacter crassamenti]